MATATATLITPSAIRDLSPWLFAFAFRVVRQRGIEEELRASAPIPPTDDPPR